MLDNIEFKSLQSITLVSSPSANGLIDCLRGFVDLLFSSGQRSYPSLHSVIIECRLENLEDLDISKIFMNILSQLALKLEGILLSEDSFIHLSSFTLAFGDTPKCALPNLINFLRLAFPKLYERKMLKVTVDAGMSLFAFSYSKPGK